MGLLSGKESACKEGDAENVDSIHGPLMIWEPRAHYFYCVC